MKAKYKSRTLWVNGFIVVAGAILGALGTDVVRENPDLAGYAIGITGVVNYLLRLVTKTAVA
jgi:hypothetical protein